VTLDVFHPDTDELNDVAFVNISYIYITFDVFQDVKD
jgi:hypothetical protein